MAWPFYNISSVSEKDHFKCSIPKENNQTPFIESSPKEILNLGCPTDGRKANGRVKMERTTEID